MGTGLQAAKEISTGNRSGYGDGKAQGFWRQALKEVMTGTPELGESGVHPPDVGSEVSHIDLFLVTRDREVKAGTRFLT